MHAIRGFIASCAALAFVAPGAAQEPGGAGEAPAPAATAPAHDATAAQGYLGFGLVLASHSVSTPAGDGDSSGGGIVGNGAGHSAPISPSLDIAFTGQVAIMGRTYDQTDEDAADVMYEVNGGLRFSELLYLSLGYTTQSTAYETSEVTSTYNVIPVGVGVLRTTEAGYVLAQVRVGGGSITDDETDDRESVGYVGLRGVFQQGSADGVQFMLGVGWDRYDIKDFDIQDDFLRVDLGLGFGL